jgi:hypothetical protein
MSDHPELFVFNEGRPIAARDTRQPWRVYEKYIFSHRRDKRHTEEQTASFAAKAVQRHELPRSRRDPYRVMMDWLQPRTGRP